MEKASGFPFGKSRGKVIYSDDVHFSSRRDNLSTFGRIQKMLSIRWAFFYYLFDNVDINPLRDFRYVANATRYSCRSICLLRKRGIYIISKPTVRAVISNLSIAKIYRAEQCEAYRLLDEDFIIIRHPLYFLKNS